MASKGVVTIRGTRKRGEGAGWSVLVTKETDAGSITVGASALQHSDAVTDALGKLPTEETRRKDAANVRASLRDKR